MPTPTAASLLVWVVSLRVDARLAPASVVARCMSASVPASSTPNLSRVAQPATHASVMMMTKQQKPLCTSQGCGRVCGKSSSRHDRVSQSLSTARSTICLDAHRRLRPAPRGRTVIRVRVTFAICGATLIISAVGGCAARSARPTSPATANTDSSEWREMTWAEYYAHVREQAWRKNMAVYWVNPPSVHAPQERRDVAR